MAQWGGYRLMSAAGTVVWTAIAVLIANHSIPQMLLTGYVPVVRRLPVVVLDGQRLFLAVGLSTAVVFSCLIPLYKPRPRRILDTIFLAQKRVLVAMFALATLGYFNMTYRLPRATLAMTMGILLIVLPAWFVILGNQPIKGEKPAIIVGDDPAQINRAADAIESPVLGYLSPPLGINIDSDQARSPTPTVTDGGTIEMPSSDLQSLGGLSRLEQILVEHDIATVVFAFRSTDRGEFFGVLETCHAHGVEAKVLREHADSVLLSDETAGELVTIDLEPWDWQDRLLKRIFDVGFALTGLTAFAPLLGLIALAIKLDSPGPVFYRQTRTAGLGRTFDVLKFRTMLPGSESSDPVDDGENDRITRVGRLLRKSHLDELPQLWAILTGDMSVVGPRAAWTDEEALLEEEAVEWRKRWFVKPGLTGLAQINDASSTNPTEKLRYDLEYIRRQSFWLDVKIVIRQMWIALLDSVKVFIGQERHDESKAR
ncbi:sugar transferase [Halalkalicoccus ordinarius]|uniref:sugar transferase n=1 Tax=Halalkalicoccus ordinarius TaxID=3116651 RepID=UPI003908045C